VFKNNDLNVLNALKNTVFFKKKQEKKKFNNIKSSISDSYCIKPQSEFYKCNYLNGFDMYRNSKIAYKNHQLKKKVLNLSNKNNFKNGNINDNLNCVNNVQSNKSSSLVNKQQNICHNLINTTNTLREKNKKYVVISNKSTLFLDNTHNLFEWKKVINQTILFLISKKIHQAEIHLKPECTGLIHIQIQMQHNQAILNLSSDHDKIKNFLNNSVDFLKTSLKKRGIQLKKVNIYSTMFFKNNQSKNHYFHNTIVNNDKFNTDMLLKKKHRILKQDRAVDLYI
jgi:flagellar hook-length control protein FliK